MVGRIAEKVRIAALICLAAQTAAGQFSLDLTSLGRQNGTAAAQAAVLYRKGAFGVWAGYGPERFKTPAIASGIWRQLGENGTLSISTRMRGMTVESHQTRLTTIHFFDSTYTDTGGWKYYPASRTYSETASIGARRQWMETEGRIAWAINRLSLEAAVGYRPRIDSLGAGRWTQAMASLPLVAGLSVASGVVTGRGGTPYSLTGGTFGFVSLKMTQSFPVAARPAPVPSSFQVRRSLTGEYIVSIRLARAHTVEVSGDFNQWKPVSLTRMADDSWELAIAVKPGTYRMNMRIDGGAWTPPPGTTAVSDEFNGKVGLVVVR